MASSDPTSERPDANGLPTSGEQVDGRYRIRELVGVGGMGAVYAATDEQRNESVALKIMLPTEAQHPDAVQRFTREAAAAQSIDSMHVARVFGAGTCCNRLPYICMELLEGASLDRVQRRRGPLPIPVAIDFILQACEGVAAAHSRGIIHRDLKPGNLHVTPGPNGTEIIKVLDFGIAKAMTTWSGDGMTLSLTETSSTLGSPRYMSPEQLRSAKNVDARADVWSLGLILYRLLTGRTAFDGDSVGAVFAKILADPPTSLRVHRTDAPVELERAIMGCLERNVLHRYQDVAQFAEALYPMAPPHAQHRPARIRQLLEASGAASPYLPLLPSQPGAVGPAPERSDVTAIAPSSRPWDASSRTPLAMSQSSGEVGGMGGGGGVDLTNTSATRRWSGSAAAPLDDSFAAAARHSTGRGSTPRLWLFALGSALTAAVAGGLGLWLLGPTGDSEVGGRGPSGASSPGAGGSESSRPADPRPVEAVASGDEPLTDGGPAMVSVHLELVPSVARVELDGVRHDENPLQIPRGSATHELRVSARGFVTERRSVDGLRDLELSIELRPVGRGRQPRANGTPTATSKGPMVDTL